MQIREIDQNLKELKQHQLGDCSCAGLVTLRHASKLTKLIQLILLSKSNIWILKFRDIYLGTFFSKIFLLQSEKMSIFN